jgi:two-component system chemotaxis sensor kinase CheA
MDEILAAFTEEAQELLEAMESGLLRLEEGDRSPEVINAIFRAAHTLKGDAGIVDLYHVEKVAHLLEDYLAKLRCGEIEVSPALVSLLLQGCDQIKAALADVVNGHVEPAADLLQAAEAMADALRKLLSPVLAAPQPPCEQSAASPSLNSAGGDALDDCWHITIRFGANVLRKRIDPLDILRHLHSKGEFAQLAVLGERIPVAEKMDPESCYIGFEIFLRSEESRESIERAFDFVRDDCELKLLSPRSKLGDTLQLIQDLPDEPMKLGEILVKSDALTADEVAQGLLSLRQANAQEPGRNGELLHLGQILVAQQKVRSEIVDAATVKQEQVAARKTGEARQIRVQAEKLDRLIDLVGELVISSAAAQLKAQKSGQADLAEANAGLVDLVENMRELSTQLRMVRIGEAFNRFRRAARDMAKDMQRDIELVIRGEETELDKSLVEKIGDPLMHLLRNALDHGIEPAEIRLARGKSAKGRVELNAYHETGGIVIEVSDDGAGLDRDKILAKAIERGLLTAEQTLSDEEIFDLIFLPGFSTAETVTSISGRGVGMDVVRSNIIALRGSVEVQSAPSQGTKFIFRLPLTMAIIDGFLVGVGKASYVIPLERVVECLELRGEDVDRHFLNLRGELLPLLRLSEFFGQQATRPERENVVVVRLGRGAVGIVVDVLHGEQQTVIKPLAALFRNLRGIAGSTILGTGEVALILDVPSLLALADRTGTAQN